MTLKHLTSPTERISKLKDALARKGFIRVMEAHNGLSGLLANDFKIEKDFEVLEFDALWESSLTDSASKGLPDIELVSMDSRLQTVEQIGRVTDKPIIFDGDTGGDISQFEYLIPRLESIGISAIIIEDKVFPKRNSLDSGAKQDLEDPRVFAEKIKVGNSIKRSRDFMIIARIESLIAGKSVEDALKRAEIYLKAGVDGIMIHSKDSSPDQIKEFASKYKELSRSIGFGKPLVAVPTTYNTILDSELKDLGFNIVIHANHSLRSSYKIMESVYKSILLNDRSFEANEFCVPVKQVFEKVGFSTITEKDKKRSRLPPVVITAAGYDSLPMRLGQGEIPKTLISINGKPFIERQLKLLNNLGFNDINIITGFQAEKFNLPNAELISNPNWKEAYVAQGTMLAKNKIKNGFIYLNADIIFDDKLMKEVLSSEGDITAVVDSSYTQHKHELEKVLDLVIAKDNPSSSFRELESNKKGEINKIGKKIPMEEATHELVPIIKFSEKGAKEFIKVYEECLKNNVGQFHEASSFLKADITDVLQEMINRGFKINFTETHKGWLELHNEKDYSRISEYFKDN